MPPPPEAAGQIAGRRIVGELFDVQPLEPLQRNQALVIRQLDQPFQVAQKTDEQRAEQTVADAAGLTVCGAWSVERGAWGAFRVLCCVRLSFKLPASSFQFPASSQPHQIIHHAERPDHHQRVPERHTQVESNRRIDAGQVDERRQHDVAEVIVADTVAGKPGVLRREEGAAEDAVDERELHRLLGAGDVRVVGSERSPADQHTQEQKLGRQHQPTVSFQPGCQRTHAVRIALPTVAAQPPGGACHDDQRDDGAAEGVGQHVQCRAQPQDVRHQQQPQRLRQGIAAARQTREQTPRQRQRSERKQLEDQPPGYRCQHNHRLKPIVPGCVPGVHRRLHRRLHRRQF